MVAAVLYPAYVKKSLRIRTATFETPIIIKKNYQASILALPKSCITQLNSLRLVFSDNTNLRLDCHINENVNHGSALFQMACKATPCFITFKSLTKLYDEYIHVKIPQLDK